MLVGGPEKLPVVIADYDERWPVRFTTERMRIAAALGPRAQRIDHIGSTAVPGLAAKPIIDILVVVDSVDDEANGQALEVAGYEVRVIEDHHRMFRTPQIDVHVHLWPPGSEPRRHLLFRDWLRHDLADRMAYAGLKRTLAKRDWEDRNAYADAKTELITEISTRAQTWAASTGWTP